MSRPNVFLANALHDLDTQARQETLLLAKVATGWSLYDDEGRAYDADDEDAPPPDTIQLTGLDNELLATVCEVRGPHGTRVWRVTTWVVTLDDTTGEVTYRLGDGHDAATWEAAQTWAEDELHRQGYRLDWRTT